MNHKNLDDTQNTSRYFVEKRQVAWMALLGTFVWGVFGFIKMPQRKDPEIPVHQTLAIARWPGVPAQRVEALLTKKVEEAVARNAKVTEIRSVTRDGVAYVYPKLDEEISDTAKELDDLRLKVDEIQLPAGAPRVQLIKDFGDTATLMLAVASPKESTSALAFRAERIGAIMQPGRVAVVWSYPPTLRSGALGRIVQDLGDWLSDEEVVKDPRPFLGSGFIGFDCVSTKSAQEISAAIAQLSDEKLKTTELHPDVWAPIVVRNPAEVAAALNEVRGPKYSYRELDRYTEQIEKVLQGVPTIGRVTRSGLVPERVELTYSQDRLARAAFRPEMLTRALQARSVPVSEGGVDTGARSVPVITNADFQNEQEIANVLIPSGLSGGVPARVSDLVNVERGYESPAQFMNFHEWRDADGKWQRERAITLDIQMRAGEQIGQFSKETDAALAAIQRQLPSDLILDRTSDQPLQVRENVTLFMSSLGEAIILVVLVSWIGFWEWRSALIMALAIPITLAMTFGMISMLGIDVQQVSIASLIIALGLLVDDPVVAGDAIKRELAAGRSPLMASWQGPTKLATAILFATLTNIVSYLPFLLLKGDIRRFLYSLPLVMTCALVASRIVSMTFIPFLGYYILRSRTEETIEQRRHKGFGAFYYRVGEWAIEHRWQVVAGAFVLLLLAFGIGSRLKQQFFPYERQYLSYIDVWLPQDASVAATSQVTAHVERIVRDVAEKYAESEKLQTPILKSLTSWVGGGAPRYWLSSNPEANYPNYAHLLVQVANKEETDKLIPLWQSALDAGVPGTTIDVRRLETSVPVGVPVAIRLSGSNVELLRDKARELKSIFESTGLATRARDDWGEDALALHLTVDADKTAMDGLTESDVARAVVGAVDGEQVGTMHDGDHTIPIIARLEMDERARLNDLSSLYVYAQNGSAHAPFSDLAKFSYEMQPARINRYQQFPTVTASSFPKYGHLPSELLMAAMPQIKQFQMNLPAGVTMEIAGEYKEQMKGFRQLSVVMMISVLCIFGALVVQFRSAVKPLIVFAAIPFGVGGALVGLAIMGAPFGFMGFLGIASLIGVIVSHIIVLFDFIEERHGMGDALKEALLDAGILRLRPVLITVAATVTALVPLALHGGPLWEPLCYAQIAGLSISTMITLLLVPVVYAIFVLDLKIVKWSDGRPGSRADQVEEDLVGAIVRPQ